MARSTTWRSAPPQDMESVTRSTRGREPCFSGTKLPVAPLPPWIPPRERRGGGRGSGSDTAPGMAVGGGWPRRAPIARCSFPREHLPDRVSSTSASTAEDSRELPTIEQANRCAIVLSSEVKERPRLVHVVHDDCCPRTEC